MVTHRLLLAMVLLLSACSASSPLPPLLVTDRGVEAIDEAGEATVLLDPDSGTVPSQATWSPDGTFAIWTEMAVDGSGGKIAMGNATSQRRIDGGTIPFFYGFSPDGTTVAYLGPDPQTGGVALGLLSVAAGSGRLVDTGSPYYIDWAPDSSGLVVHANQADLYLLSTEGERTDLASSPDAYQAPAYLPGGELLIARDGQLTVLEPDSGESRAITDLGGFSAFAPSPDGVQVALIDNPEPAPGLLSLISIDGGESTQIDSDPVIFFDWSPDGTRLAFLTLTADGLVPGIWSDGEVTKLEPIIPTRTFLNGYLPFWDQYSRTMTMWRADSSGFLLPRAEGDANRIAFYPGDGGPSEVVTSGQMAIPAP